MRVRRIPARHERQQKRVAAYCRVSTNLAEQEESFETQVGYYTRFIQSNPDWIMVKVYADHGISGTSAKKRPQFMAMIEDAMSGKTDLILVKSISRFSRNLVECQQYVRQLKARGVEVRFERERISSFDPTSDFVFSLLSAVAQDESRSISENIRWYYRRRFERGEYCLGSNRILGYDTDPKTKKLVPNKDAWIVKLAFERFVRGVPYQKIADELAAMGAERLYGKTPLGVSAIQYIVSNETYVGDKLLQKSPPLDFLTKRPDPNAEYTSYYVRDDHEPIIDRETWEKAQAILQQRRDEVSRGIQKRGISHHPFYGKLFCGLCGEAYTRRTFTTHSAEGKRYYAAWNCRERQKGKAGNGCKGRTVKEAELEQTIALELGWEAFDAEWFEREVEYVEVMENGLRVVRKEDCVKNVTHALSTPENVPILT